MGWWRLVPIVLVVAYLGYHWMSADEFVNPVTGESHKVAMNSQEEQALGAQAFSKVLSESDVLTSGPEVEAVQRVADRIIQVANKDADSFKWEVVVVRSPEANAFCMPGGKIVVYTGILKHAQTEAGLAVVIAHEIAHAIARHGAQRVFQQEQAQAVMLGAQGSIADMDYQQQQMIMGVIGAGAQYGFLLPYSRKHESEADYMGLLYMAKAGFDPREAPEFWKRMGQAHSHGQPAEWQSTHPSHETRISDLEAWMPQALEIYRQSGGQ